MPIDELTAIVRREFIDQVRDLDNPHWKDQTPDYLKEVCAKAGYPKPDEAADFFARAAASAVRRAVIDECLQIVSAGVKWEPEEFYSDTHIKASNETAYLLAKALEGLKGETDV